MARNEGTVDRALRVILGIVLIVMALRGIYAPWTWIGVVPLATAAIGWCPAYLPFGISTARKK